MPEDLRITAAAVLHNGKLYTGKRHAEIMRQIWDEGGGRITLEEQGFVASDGKFYNRYQAGAIAYMAGQTEGRHEYLLSEHVW